MMHGMAYEVFPDVLRDSGVDNIMFNAYEDEQRLANINTLVKRSTEDMSAVITSMGLDAGFMVYPYGQRLDIMCDRGTLLGKQKALCVVLSLLNMEANSLGRTMRVFLPTWASDITCFDALEIERGQYANFKAEQMRQYDLVATGEGSFAFTKFATHRDSMFATLKILEMMIKYDAKLSELIDAVPKFYYHATRVPCSQSLKGKMMRMFLESAKGKRASTVDGVKIWLGKNDWILMIPDQYGDYLNLYIQAETDEDGDKILDEYSAKIAEWAKA